MNAEQAVKLAESGKNLQAVLIHAVHAVMHIKDVEKLDGRGICFSCLYRHEGTIVAIPNGNCDE